MTEPLRVATVTTPPCEKCGTKNGVCARPPGALHLDDDGRCVTCQHTSACHEW